MRYLKPTFNANLLRNNIHLRLEDALKHTAVMRTHSGHLRKHASITGERFSNLNVVRSISVRKCNTMFLQYRSIGTNNCRRRKVFALSCASSLLEPSGKQRDDSRDLPLATHEAKYDTNVRHASNSSLFLSLSLRTHSETLNIVVAECV